MKQAWQRRIRPGESSSRRMLLRFVLIAVMALGVPRTALPQSAPGLLHGLVLSLADSAPVAGSRIQWADGGGSARVIGNRFQIEYPGNTRRLIVTALGFAPRSVDVDARTPLPMRIYLAPAPPQLADLVTVRPAHLSQGGTGEWIVGGEAARALAATVEPDAFRSLKVVPAVSFTSILSARPLVRGADADDAGFTIDGHEVMNLFHLGRFFSAFPALAVGELTVLTQPGRVDMGRTTSGRVAIRGAEWTRDRRPEVQYGVGAWSAAAGWRATGTTGILTGRTIAGSPTGLATGGSAVSLAIHDLYGRVDVRGSVPASLTFFRSVDRVVASDDASDCVRRTAGLDWGNLLVGATVGLLATRTLELTARAVYSDHFESGTDIPARDTRTDVDNLSRRIGGRLDSRWQFGGVGHAVRAGMEVNRRSIRNVLTPVDPTLLPSVALDRDVAETAGYAEFELAVLGGWLRAGARYDALAGVTTVQPKASLSIPLTRNAWVSLGAGRASRLVHLLSDARTEPKFAYYDIWLPADGVDVPAAQTDHVAADVGGERGNVVWRVGVFAAAGRGQLEFQPEVPRVAHSTPWRIGRLRVRGAEVEWRATSANNRFVGQLAYTYQVSERDWGTGWAPWGNDRRHQLRGFAVFRPTPRTTMSAGVDVVGGQPYTPYDRTEVIDGEYVHLYGPEYSARGGAGARGEVSVQRAMRGPFGTELGIGLSVTNLSIGDQSARTAVVRAPGDTHLPVSLELFRLPPLPSILVRVAF